MKELFYKIIKFGVVGFSGLIIDFGITYLCKEQLRMNKYVANTLGFCCAASSNFILNRIWTFHSSDPSVYYQYFMFVGIAVIGLLVNNLIIFYLTERKKFNFYASKAIAIVVVMLWNFSVNYLYTFKK